MITDQKFYLPGGLTNGQGGLPVAITARIEQSGRLLTSKPNSCEIISKSDQRFLRSRFFKNFFMSAYRNKRTMMVQYHSPEYKAVQVNNEDKYQTDYQILIFLFQEQTRKICDAMHHGSHNVLDYNFKNISVTLTLYHTVQF